MYCELPSTVFLWDHDLYWEKLAVLWDVIWYVIQGFAFLFLGVRNVCSIIWFISDKSRVTTTENQSGIKSSWFSQKNMHFNSVYVLGIKDVENRAITVTAKRKVSLCFIFPLLCWLSGNRESGQRTKNEDKSDWVREKSEI